MSKIIFSVTVLQLHAWSFFVAYPRKNITPELLIAVHKNLLKLILKLSLNCQKFQNFENEKNFPEIMLFCFSFR